MGDRNKAISEAFITTLEAIIGGENVLRDEPMAKHTTFRIGGPADLFVLPRRTEHLIYVIHNCREAGIPYFILGNGSNLLVHDEGYRGVVIQLDHNFEGSLIEGACIHARAGMLLSKLAATAAADGLTGLEFASGIPGTVGGGVTMNAGAYGGEIKDVLIWAEVLTDDLQIRTVSKEELALGYRHSRIMEESWIVLHAAFALQSGDPAKIHARMEELREARIAKQPLEYPSAGSTFKRPEGHFAGKLIMDSGLAGARVGGAQVSEKHCGFVINCDPATAEDVRALIRHIQETVKVNAGVSLETEVRFLGFGE